MEIDIKKRQRISSIQAIFMLAVAGIFDLAQGLLTAGFIGVIINSFIGIFAWLTFYLWFRLSGVGFLDGKMVLKIITLWGGAFIEIIPVINTFPAWMATVVIMLLIIRAEDAIFNKTGKNIKIQKIIKKIR